MNQPIASLNVPMDIINKLKNSGFHHCEDVKENEETINSTTNFSSWSSVLQPPKPKTALELLNDEESQFRSPIPKLNQILRAVIVPGCITELCGLPGSGKTQICLNLVAGMKGVVFIHTNRNLNRDRLREICTQKQLEDTFCIKVTDFTELLASVEFLETFLRVEMVIIDSITWPLKQKAPLERSSLACTLFQKLRNLTKTRPLSIVITNDLTTRIAEDDTFYTSCFGDSFYHLINNRVLLTKTGSFHTAEILKSVTRYHAAVSFQF